MGGPLGSKSTVAHPAGIYSSKMADEGVVGIMSIQLEDRAISPKMFMKEISFHRM